MKKVLALTLSAVLAMGAMTTAFAETRITLNGTTWGNTMDRSYLWLVNDDDDTDAFAWAGGSKEKMEWDTEYNFEISLKNEDGKTVIYAIEDKEDGDIVAAYDAENYSDALAKGSYAAADYNANKVATTDDLFELVDANKASLKVKVNDGREYIDTIKVNDSGDEMYLDIITIDSMSTKDGEFGFELTLESKGSNSDFKDRTFTVRDQKIGYKVAEGTTYDSALNVKSEGTILDTEDMEACEDYEITWGDDEIAMFVVDIDDNEGKKNLDYTTAPVDALIEANPDANMDFFTLKAAPRFNKIGTMTIYADGDIFKYIYEVDADGQLKEINATYDEDEEGFVFTTRQLGSYVVSDVELVGAAIDEEVPGESDTTEVPGESDTTTTDDGRENPETGANDMVNVAAAMAVVSLAAAGAVAFKKSSK